MKKSENTTDTTATNASRRDFLAKAAVVGTVTIAPGVLLHQAARAATAEVEVEVVEVIELDAEPDKNTSRSTRPLDQEVSDKNRWGMLIDTNKCARGCTSCVDACNEANGLEGKTGPQDTQYIRKVTLKSKSTGHETSLPLMCQHCESAPCVDVCPTGASFIRADGIALVDRHICIGCRYCMMACPYKARSFVHEDIKNQKLSAPRGKGTVEACNLCVTRVDHGGLPACVEACTAENHNAMIFGDLKDPNSPISIELRKYGGKQLRSDLALNTGVRYQGLNE
ncbi:MAG TPA: 4Fe-4S dicluster domain-containing protein [Gammaproteobacteria bacterium]|nr:4Fe-4S dicluster domain-containing protein [Gammaproteobacteria bacterium]